jgi:hypothetical protein
MLLCSTKMNEQLALSILGDAGRLEIRVEIGFELEVDDRPRHGRAKV